MHLAHSTLGLMISLLARHDGLYKTDSKQLAMAVLQGDIWQQHGKAVADALYYLPSFLRTPLVTSQRRLQVDTRPGVPLVLVWLGTWALYGSCLSVIIRTT